MWFQSVRSLFSIVFLRFLDIRWHGRLHLYNENGGPCQHPCKSCCMYEVINYRKIGASRFQYVPLWNFEPRPHCLWLNSVSPNLTLMIVPKLHVLTAGVISSTFWIAQILVHLHFELVNLLLTPGATELVSEPVTQMAVELINNHLISVQQKKSV